jgi:apolipoprotein N-acyltransferase
MIVFINVLFYVALGEAIKRLDGNGLKAVLKSLKNKKTAILSAAALVIFTANLVFGVIRVATLDAKKGAPIKAAVIQANISSYDNKGFYYSFDKYIKMTEDCVSETGAKIVVWPETVLVAEINKYKGVMAELQITARLNNIYLLVGAFDEKELDGVRQEYNAIYLFRPDGSVDEQRYYKRQLVPFGESNPLGAIAKILPFELFDFFNDSKLVAGDSPNLFDTEYGKIGATICFDSIYEYVTREATQEGAQIITLSTNDSWFSDSKAVYQHNRHAQIRAIENGRYIARAASTGTSTVISPNGQVLIQLAPLTEGYTTYDVYALSNRTLYTYVGDVVAYIALAFVVGVVSFNVVNHFKNKKGVKNDDSSKS